jgi:hypothetical protein
MITHKGQTAEPIMASVGINLFLYFAQGHNQSLLYIVLDLLASLTCVVSFYCCHRRTLESILPLNQSHDSFIQSTNRAPRLRLCSSSTRTYTLCFHH